MAFSTFCSLNFVPSFLSNPVDTLHLKNSSITLGGTTGGGIAVDNYGNIVASNNTNVYYSVNKGSSFTQSSTLPSGVTSIGDISMSQTGVVLIITNGGTVRGCVSTNYGASFTQISTSTGYNPTTGNVFNCQIDTTGTYMLFNHKAGGVWFSTNGGSNFSTIYSSAGSYVAMSASGQYIGLLTTDQCSTNYGATFSSATYPRNAYSGAIDNNNQLATCCASPLDYSTTGLTGTFNTSSLSITMRNCRVDSCSSDGNVYCVCSTAGVAYLMLNKNGTFINLNTSFGLSGASMITCSVSPNGKYIALIGGTGIYLYTFVESY